MPRMAVPKSWPIERKISRWILRPVCGPHAIEDCLPIGVILKEILKHSKTTKEANFILITRNALMHGTIHKLQSLTQALYEKGKMGHHLWSNALGVYPCEGGQPCLCGASSHNASLGELMAGGK